MLEILAFDADDTLWHNEPHFNQTHDKFRNLLADYHDPEWVERRLVETEIRNLKHFGYGVKGFTLSMIETAVELTEGRITGDEIEQIITFGKAMLNAPLRLIDDVPEVLNTLGKHYDLMIITKGDLFDQETKIARSGLAEHFKYIEIVSEKHPEQYRSILQRHQIQPKSFLMTGNSLKSDVLPTLSIGGHAVHVPYHTTWIHEKVAPELLTSHTFHTVSKLCELPALLEKLQQS